MRMTVQISSEIPKGYCHCGCGQRTKISNRDDPRYGIKKGEPRAFVHNHHTKGARNRLYNMGLSFSKSLKRWRVVCRDGSTVLYSRVVMEGHLCRELRPEEVVHHINHDSADDRIENLGLVPTKGLHRTLHRGEKRNTPPRHSREYLLDSLKRYCAELGRPATSGDMIQSLRPSYVPSYTPYRLRFPNGLKGALKEVGIIG
jgi:hypothetical protein